jgi:glyoxylase-like metal-dependent hydrolase (beta-lactamase superfamily II)
MGLEVTSEGRRLLCVADAVFHPLQLQYPYWLSPHDLRPEQALHSRLRLLDRAVAEQALVHASHFPFPGLGRVLAEGNTWRWQPVAHAPSADAEYPLKPTRRRAHE